MAPAMGRRPRLTAVTILSRHRRMTANRATPGAAALMATSMSAPTATRRCTRLNFPSLTGRCNTRLDDAQMWYHRLELNGGPPLWNHFVQLVKIWFGPPLTDDPIGELTLLQRDGSVDNFCARFMSLSCCDPDISEDHRIHGRPRTTLAHGRRVAEASDAGRASHVRPRLRAEGQATTGHDHVTKPLGRPPSCPVGGVRITLRQRQ
jgi:hypothetical protein